MKEIYSALRELIDGLKTNPWPVFLSLSIAMGTWGWINYVAVVKENRQIEHESRQQVLAAKDGELKAKEMLVEYQAKIINKLMQPADSIR